MASSNIEILAPAGSWDSLSAALRAGADAVYFGVGALNMRAGSSANFTVDDLPHIVRLCRAAGVRTRLTVNTIIYDEELPAMRATIDAAAAAGIDAVIVSDQAAMLYASSRGIEVHISTQLNVSNSESLRFYAQWASTIVLARELTLEQISVIARSNNSASVIARSNNSASVIARNREGRSGTKQSSEHVIARNREGRSGTWQSQCAPIKKAASFRAAVGGVESASEASPQKHPPKIEMFAHGALCMAVSGRCYLSAHDCGASANRGACRQICRRSYTLTDTVSGAQIVAEGGFLLSPRDLCTLPFLDKMLAAGVSVLKIEGRARSAEYVSRVVACYREAVDAIVAGTFSQELVDRLMPRLGEVFNRGFWGGYYLGAPVVELSQQYGSSATRRKVYVGKVTNYFRRAGVAEVLIEASPLPEGADVVVIGNTTGALEFTASGLLVNGAAVAEAQQTKYCSLQTPAPVRRGDKLYKYE